MWLTLALQNLGPAASITKSRSCWQESAPHWLLHRWSQFRVVRWPAATSVPCHMDFPIEQLTRSQLTLSEQKLRRARERESSSKMEVSLLLPNLRSNYLIAFALFSIKRKMLGSKHTQVVGITQRCDYQEVGITRGYLRKLPTWEAPEWRSDRKWQLVILHNFSHRLEPLKVLEQGRNQIRAEG